MDALRPQKFTSVYRSVSMYAAKLYADRNCGYRIEMLPPVLEIYVVWHPGDRAGAVAGEQVVQHFHGTAFSGLIGGAVEVYVRSEGWRGDEDAPRPIPLPRAPPPNNVAQAELTAIVPVLGTEMAGAVEQRAGAWYE